MPPSHRKHTLSFINDSHFKSDSKHAFPQNWTMHSDPTARLPPNKTTSFFVFLAQMWFVDSVLEALSSVETVWVEPCRARPGRARLGIKPVCCGPSLRLSELRVFPARDPKESRAVRQRCGCRCYDQLFIALPLIVSTSPGLNWITRECSLSNLTLPAKDPRCCEVCESETLFWVFSLFSLFFYLFLFLLSTSCQVNNWTCCHTSINK